MYGYGYGEVLYEIELKRTYFAGRRRESRRAVEMTMGLENNGIEKILEKCMKSTLGLILLCMHT
jgi:hypothetical protein